jgi:hypothetical protein
LPTAPPGALATTTPTTSRYPGAPASGPRCARSWWGRGSSPPMAPA